MIINENELGEGIWEILMNGNRLIELDISKNGLDDICGEWIWNMLIDSNIIWELNIEYNRLSGDGIW